MLMRSIFVVSLTDSLTLEEYSRLLFFCAAGIDINIYFIPDSKE